MRTRALTALLIASVAPVSAHAGDGFPISTWRYDFSYADLSTIQRTSTDVFVSVTMPGVLDPLDGGVVIRETVTADDEGEVFSSSLSGSVADRLTNGDNDQVWTGTTSDDGSDFVPRFENVLFAGQSGPGGEVVVGPDLQGLEPTRVELTLTDISFDWDGTRTAIDGTVSVRFFVEDGPGGPCTPSDLAEPFGVLDLEDLNTFVEAFTAGEPEADLAGPDGVFDLADITTFVDLFNQGCP